MQQQLLLPQLPWSSQLLECWVYLVCNPRPELFQDPIPDPFLL